jgi:hypothetical protein
MAAEPSKYKCNRKFSSGDLDPEAALGLQKVVKGAKTPF